MRKTILTGLGLLLSMPATAAWQLDETESTMHFLSTKNAQITELHTFESLSGTISDSGELTVTIPLSSVNTSIEIRDTRMKEKLFETSQYPKAVFSASLSQDILGMAAGESGIYTVEGAIDLHDKNVATTFNVAVSRLDDATFRVTTVAPTLLSAGDFGLADGVKTLQAIAGLDSISMTVPVTFSVVFDKQ